MNFNRSAVFKLATAGVVAAAALFGVSSASAGANWSIGIAVPGVVIGGGEPAYYEPAPVYSAPPPAYYRPAPPDYYRQAPRAYYTPAPIYYEPAYRGEGRRFRRDWDGDRHYRRDWERREHRRDWNDRD